MNSLPCISFGRGVTLFSVCLFSVSLHARWWYIVCNLSSIGSNPRLFCVRNWFRVDSLYCMWGPDIWKDPYLMVSWLPEVMCYWLFMMFILSMKAFMGSSRRRSLVTSSWMVYGLVMPIESRLSIMVWDITSLDLTFSLLLERISVSSWLRFRSARALSMARSYVFSPGFIASYSDI